MEVIEQKIDDLNTELLIRIEQDDYKVQYEEALKKIKKQVNIPGFRNGKVPTQVIKKRYGASVLADELNKLLNEGLHNHLTTNNIKILGSPLPKTDDNQPGDWENPSTFEFRYHLGLSPDFELKFGKDKYKYYRVKVDDKLIDRQIDDIRRRYGKLEEVNEVGEKDLVLGEFCELDKKGNELEGGVSHESSISLEFIEDAKSKKNIVGLKVGEAVEVNPFKVSKGDADTAAMLGIDKDKLKEISDKFRFTVKNVKRIHLAEMNQEFFDKIFGPDQVTDEEGMRAKVKEDLSRMFEKDSDRILMRDVTEALMEKHKFQLPDDFLKRWILESTNNEKKDGEELLTMQQVEAEYDAYSKSLRWQLIENRLIQENNLQVNETEVVNFTMGLLARNYQQYNVPVPEPKELEESARRVLQNQDEARKVSDMLYEEKLMQFFKTDGKLSEKEVSYDDFLKIASKEK